MVALTEVLLAALPLLVIGYLMVIRFWSATRAMPVAWVVAIGAAVVGWQMTPRWVAAATVNGLFTALQLLWIIFGALLLLYTLMQTGAFDAINRGFTAISEDRRVQVVLLVFLFGSFLEGVAGFGSPAAIVGPLLVGLGFPPLAAVVIALTGNLMAITFGAVGLPLIIGMQDVFSGISRIQNAVNNEGMSIAQWVAEIGTWAATYHAIVGIAVPFIGVAMMTRFFGEERSIRPALKVLPLCLFAWGSFVIPYWLTAAFLGPEFPAIFGAMIGLVLTSAMLRAGFLHPDEEWDFGDQASWPDHWIGDIEPGEEQARGESGITADGGITKMPLWKAWAPYVFLAFILVLTRIIGPIQSFLQTTFVLEWATILGTDLTGSLQVLYVPGAVFVFVHLLTIPFHQMSRTEIRNAWSETVENILPAAIALIFAVPAVFIMLYSGNAANVDGMLIVLSTATSDVFGAAYPFFAAMIGALGAFLSGSNTTSDILFGTFQYGVATNLGISRTILLGAQAVGGAIGNVIAIHNVVAAVTVVGLLGEEGRVIRYELIPAAYYSVFTGLLALLFIYVLFPGVF
jgi:lactate permease